MNLRTLSSTLFDVWAAGLIQQAKATPYFHLEGYMERWWLQRPEGHGEHSDTSDKAKTGKGARIHHILRSDNERHLHDHPWPSTSVVLFGGYHEVLPRDQQQDPALDEDPAHFLVLWRAPGDVVQRAAGDRHRIVLPHGCTSWSLFLMGDYAQGWGFYTPQGKVPWREYLGIQEAA